MPIRLKKLKKPLIHSLTNNMKNALYKKILIPAISVVSLLSAFAQAGAQTEDSGIPENLAPLAQELGCETQEECAKAFDSNFEKGIELAEKYKVYSAEQQKIAQSFRQEVINKLIGVGDDNFEEEILKIAQEILKKPTLAKTLQVDKEEVEAVQTIITEVKNAGVNVDVCSRPANLLSREELIACLEASKKLAGQSSIVEKYIPKGIKEKTRMLDATVGLDAALARGEYADLGKTSEEVGQKCLRPDSESLKVCDEIAEKYFGPEGVKELAAARAQTARAGDFYLKNLANLELVTPDGQKISGKNAIRTTCDSAFQNRNIGLAKACGEFAVKNGLADKNEVEEGLKIFESFASKPQINFDDCRNNPESCRDFMPEEFRKDFDSEIKIYEIMKAEMGFDPVECERGNVDFEIGRKCFEASKKALPKLKEIAADYPEVQRMISEIEFGLKRETEQNQRGDDFGKFFNQQGGPGGCKNEQECFAYCNDPAHGAECISFGAKHEVFQGNEAVERFQRYNDVLTSPSPFNYNQAGQYGQYPTDDNRGYVNQDRFNVSGPSGPSPECFAAIQSGDFVKAKEICSAPANPYQYQPSQIPPYPIYPDNRYSSIPNYQQSSAPVNRICPARPEFDCQSGYQKIYKTTADGCSISECVPVSVSSYPSSSYSSYYYNSASSCPSNLLGSGCHDMGNAHFNGAMDQYVPYGGSTVKNCSTEYINGCTVWGSSSSYSYSSYNYNSSCPSGVASLLGSGCHYMYNDSSGNSIYCNGEMTKSAKAGDTATTEGCSSGNYSSYSYSSYNYVPPTGQREQIWNSYGLRSWIRTDADLARIESLKQACANVTSSSWDIWLPGAGNYQNVDFGMPDETKCRSWTPGSSSSYSYSSYPSSAYSSYSYSSYPSSAYSSYSYSSYSSYGYTGSCSSSLINLLGTGCHYMHNDSSGNAIYCNGEMTKSAKTGDTATTEECSSGGYSSGGYYSSYSYSSYYSSSASNCPTNLLGSGCHDMGNAHFNGAMDQYVNYGGSVVKNCSIEYINGCTVWGSSSSYSYSPASSASYSSYDPSTACAQAGGTWDGSYCQMPNTASSAAYSSYNAIDPSTACAQAGGTWDGSACQMPNSGSSSSATQNPALVIWLFNKIINFFSR